MPLKTSESEQLLLPPQISERSDVGNVQRHSKLIFRADLAQGQAHIFKGDSATGTVIAHLHELILQNVLFQIVTETNAALQPRRFKSPYPAWARNLIRDRLKDGVVIDGKMRNREIEILRRMNFEQRARRREPPADGIVIETDFGIIYSAGSDEQFAVNRRKMARLIGERKGRNRVQRLKDIARSGNERAVERRVEIILLRDSPTDQFIRRPSPVR